MADEVKRRRSFPDAFKREAAAAVQAGRSASQVAASDCYGTVQRNYDRLLGQPGSAKAPYWG